MRLLPKSLVIHRWVVESEKMPLKPISESSDGQTLHLARRELIQPFNQMVADAQKENVRLKVLWAFRSKEMQAKHFYEAQQKHGKRGAIRWVASPGYSEHHTGWVLDIGDAADPQADDNPLFERTAAFRWLSRNARRYGFELSFPKNNWQGVGYEPWHWRFVGTAEAKSTFHPGQVEKLWVWSLSWIEALTRWIRG